MERMSAARLASNIENIRISRNFRGFRELFENFRGIFEDFEKLKVCEFH